MRLANGPASTHVKSTMRSPSSGLPADVGPAWRRSAGVGAGASTRGPLGEHVVDVGGRRRRRLLAPATACRGTGRTARACARRRSRRRRGTMPRNAYCGFVGHLGDGLHLAEGDVAALGLVEQLARVLGEGEALDRVHHPGHLGRAPPRSSAWTARRPPGRPPRPSTRTAAPAAGRGRCCTAPGLGVGHDVGAEPVQRSLAQRPLGDRQQVGEPPLEEQVLDRRRHHLVQRQVDELALCRSRAPTYTPARPQMHAISEPKLRFWRPHAPIGLVGRAARC